MHYIKKTINHDNQVDGILEKYSQDIAIQRVNGHLSSKVSHRLRDIMQSRKLAGKKKGAH